jgi:hypothetical protein
MSYAQDARPMSEPAHEFAGRKDGHRFDVVSGRLQQLVTLVLLLNPQLALGLYAQQEPTLERGSHIEIVSERLPGGIAVGWLETLTKDTLTFVDSSGTTAVALQDIGQLMVNVGRDKSSINTATLLGAMLGAVVATLTAPESYECTSSLAFDGECAHEVPPELVGALLGAGAFRMLATFTAAERWKNVRLDRLLYSVSAQDRP